MTYYDSHSTSNALAAADDFLHSPGRFLHLGNFLTRERGLAKGMCLAYPGTRGTWVCKHFPPSNGDHAGIPT
eukprot:3722178-Rhodomonas_salina.1